MMKTPKFITQADYEKAVLQNIERSKAIDELNKLILAKMTPSYENINGAFPSRCSGSQMVIDSYVFKLPEPCDHVLERDDYSLGHIDKIKVLSGICPKCNEEVVS